MNERESKEVLIFNATLELSAPAERAAYLDKACAGDSLLRERVEALLLVHAEANSFFGTAPGEGERLLFPAPAVPVGPGGTLLVAPITEKEGDRIGRYKLLQQIGEGGCGTVYMAEQEEPVRRRVALKVIKLGMDTKSVIARFEAERQALALMDHPNIAKVLDAGATDTGRPYFVMELVRGVRITEYCDEARLSTHERLDLFVKVCQAIQHAHQKGIIHRDIKPSNILVTVNDGVPVPKVIDFGIAKATTGQRLTDLTLFTAFEQFIGTPAYMSPEQAVMTSVDIDTRSDIYSLGVLLYELLTGKTPFDPKELLASGLDEMRRTIRDKEPQRPSTRLSTMLEGDLTTTAQHRRADAPKLINLLRGDLDWIVMRALDKDRARRYETANALATDIQHHLYNEPVMARPPSVVYRFQKMVRRNKLTFFAAGAVTAALLVGLFFASWQAVRAKKAEQAARLAAHAEKTQAEQARADRDRAVRAESGARAQATSARRYAYAAEINVALQSLAENNLNRARELLDRQRPKAGEEDLRGFEWRYLWRLCHGDEFATFRDEGAHAAAFSLDGRFLAYSGGRIIVRDALSQKVLTVLSNPATTLSFAPHTNIMASGHNSGVKIWDTETWQLVRSLPDAVQPSLFSPDGRWLLTGLAGGFRLWDTHTWQPAGDGPSGARLIWQSRNAVAFSPDSQILVTLGTDGMELGDHLRVWRLPGLDELPPLRFNREPPGAAAFSVNGKQVLAGLWDGQLVVWDLATRKVVATPREHTAWITAIAVAPDGKTFVTASADRTVILWDAATFKPLVRLRGHVREVWSAAISPDGRTIVSGSNEGTTKLWSAHTLHTDAVLEGASIVVGFGGGGSQVVAGMTNGLCVWTPETGVRTDVLIPDLPIVDRAKRYDVKPDALLAAVGRRDGSIEIWDLKAGAKLAGWPAHTDAISAIAFSPDGKQLATAIIQGGAKIWDFATRREVARVGSVDIRLNCLAFSPDGKILAACGLSSRIWLWDVSTGSQILELPGEGSHAVTLAFSPDGKLLVTTTESNKARLWEVSSGKLLAILDGHVQGVVAVAFSPDGKTLATGGMDRKVKLWNMATHQELATFPLGGLFPTLGFSPDGRMLALGSLHDAGRRIQVLSAPSFEEITAAEASQQREIRQ